MSAGMGIALAIVTLASCYASYRIGFTDGQMDILTRFQDYLDNKRNKRPDEK